LIRAPANRPATKALTLLGADMAALLNKAEEKPKEPQSAVERGEDGGLLRELARSLKMNSEKSCASRSHRPTHRTARENSGVST